MPICKVIVRVDTPTSFDLMDRPGSLARLMASRVEQTKLFSTVQEQPQTKEFRAFFQEGPVRREFKASPNYILFSYQTADGIDLESVREDSIFSDLIGLMTEIRRDFAIKQENRSGLRLLYLSKIGSDRKTFMQAFRKMLDARLHDVTVKALGKSTDYGVSFDGGGPEGDAPQYHLRMGPFLGTAEAQKYFEEPPDAALIRDSDFVCDLDQFQHKTKWGPDLAWWKPLLISANNLIPKLEAVLKAELRALANAKSGTN